MHRKLQGKCSKKQPIREGHKMAKQDGAKIKEARNAAGMTQAEVAKAAEIVSAKALSEAERGTRELTPEELEAVAKVIGVTVESLLAAEAEIPAESTEKAPKKAKKASGKSANLTAEEKELLELYRSADSEKQKAAEAALKGEQPAANRDLTFGIREKVFVL